MGATPAGDAAPWLALGVSTGFLYRAQTGDAYQNFSSNFNQVMRRVIGEQAAAEKPFRRFRAHDLRHGFAIRWLKQGGNIYRLSRHLGHTSVKTTEIYLDYLSEDEMERVRDAPHTITPTDTQKRGPK